MMIFFAEAKALPLVTGGFELVLAAYEDALNGLDQAVVCWLLQNFEI